MKSPLSISYNDLINEAKERLHWMEANYPAMVIQRKIRGDTARHKIECQKKILWLLMKSKKDPQLDLFQTFEKHKQ